MIISCACGARLKISDEKLTPAGVKIKCPKCATVHLARKQGAAEPEAGRPLQAAPAAAPGQAMPWFAAASPAMQQDGPLVLIAHDSSVVAEMIAGALREAGMRSDYAPNGLEALKKATELKPQAMVVDVGLTGIYGFELCERLKSDPGTKLIKIILLSSVYGLTAYKRAPVTLYGADDYIEKHHIPDQLVPKLKRLLSGETVPAPESPQAATGAAEQPEAPRPPLAPLVSRKGVLQQPESAPIVPQSAAPDVKPEPVMMDQPAVERAIPGSVPASPAKTAGAGFAVPEIPSVLPKTPVTLDGGGGRREAPKQQEPPKPVVKPVPPEPVVVKEPAVPPAPTRKPEAEVLAADIPGAEALESDAAIPLPPAHEDGSIKLDAGFFEHEEYEAPTTATPSAAVDPAEIEKARRFARIIVSDIALYNQDAANEGVRDGTFYDLLKDDIAEGRALYEGRVPTAIRATKDYLQEAFDEFIAAKKKLR